VEETLISLLKDTGLMCRSVTKVNYLSAHNNY